MGAASAILVVLITLLFPPAGVFCVAGCGADILINVCLTILGYIPGHIHAFYLEYVYYERRERALSGQYAAHRAPGVYSERVQTGGGAHVVGSGHGVHGGHHGAAPGGQQTYGTIPGHA